MQPFFASLVCLVFDKQDEFFNVEQQEERGMAKRKMLGNIKFIGKQNAFGRDAFLNKQTDWLIHSLI